jgi:hypothetical protein
MVIRDLDFPSISFFPFEAYAILAVDPDRVLASSVSGKRMEPIRGRGELPNVGRRVDLVELRPGLAPESRRKAPSRSLCIRAFEDGPGIPIPEGPDHA